MVDYKCIKSTFDRLLDNNDTVFIVPHNRPDFDALGAAIGVSLICSKNNKKSYIVINESFDELELETGKALLKIKNNFDIVRSSDLDELLTGKSLMVAVDANKDYLLSTKSDLLRFRDIMVIDHHKTDDHTIKTFDMFVDDKVSSACEMISELLKLYDVELTPENANYILAGIILDTNKFSKNTSADTFMNAAYLTSKGANPTLSNNMFLEDFEHDRAVQRLVDNTDFINYIFAISCACDDSNVYDVEDIAKAADYLLKYKVGATFAMAHIDDETVSISARSKGTIDVSRIMKLFGGGGNEFSAAAKIKGKSLQEVKKSLCDILVPNSVVENYSLEENEPQIDSALKLMPKPNVEI